MSAIHITALWKLFGPTVAVSASVILRKPLHKITNDRRYSLKVVFTAKTFPPQRVVVLTCVCPLPKRRIKPDCCGCVNVFLFLGLGMG